MVFLGEIYAICWEKVEAEECTTQEGVGKHLALMWEAQPSSNLDKHDRSFDVKLIN